jgi:hypothetical protein
MMDSVQLHVRNVMQAVIPALLAWLPASCVNLVRIQTKARLKAVSHALKAPLPTSLGLHLRTHAGFVPIDAVKVQQTVLASVGLCWLIASVCPAQQAPSRHQTTTAQGVRLAISHLQGVQIVLRVKQVHTALTHLQAPAHHAMEDRTALLRQLQTGAAVKAVMQEHFQLSWEHPHGPFARPAPADFSPIKMPLLSAGHAFQAHTVLHQVQPPAQSAAQALQLDTAVPPPAHHV